jgi:phage-related minor tail protein
MANRIKGITIEIGGDTTKLDKALAGTNKTLSNTQKQLRDVEKLLKLDPGNTELLAQKQRLLAESVEATSEKLETLRQAAENADRALQRGNEYKAAYEPLKNQLDDVNASIQALEANAESMKRKLDAGEISTSQYDAFARKLEDTRKRANDLEKAIEDVNQEFSGAKIDQKQYDALQRELIETEQAAKDAAKEFEEFNVTIQKFNAAAGQVATGAGKVQAATQGLSTAATGILAAAAATVPATEELRNSMSVLETNARNVGVSFGAAEAALKNFNVVSGELDSSLEATSNLLQAGFTESNLQAAVENLAGAYLRFPDTLKIESLADSLQETLATGEATGQFGELLDRLGVGAENFNAQLALIPDEVSRQNYVLGLLASEGLAATYQGWRQNNEELVESREASYEFQQAMAELAETIQPFLTMIVDLGTQVLDFFNSLPPGVQAAIGVFLILIATISPLAGIVSAVAVAVGTAGIAMSSWLPIILAVTAALVALAAIIGIVAGGGSSSRGSGGFGGDRQGSGFGASSRMPEDAPHFATGGVVPPNNPFLAVLGDNRTEPEIVAPYSAIKQATSDAIAERGGNAPATIIVRAADGFTRHLSFALSEESTRRGVSLVNE